MNKIKAIILANELAGDHRGWVDACENSRNVLDYRVVNLTSSGWLQDIREQPADILLAKPGGLTAQLKQLYDERIFILDKVLEQTIFPSPEEIYIYENKRFFSSWLEANGIPHPLTYVIYDYEEALKFIRENALPVVAKTSTGASGSGVTILKSVDEAVRYVNDSFYGAGSPQRTGPNMDKGGLAKRGSYYLFHPRELGRKIFIYRSRAANRQKGFVIFQAFVSHDYEWRAVRIGDSFFAHKKIRAADKASGSLMKNYDNPPLSLLDFVMGITDKHHFYSQAIDIFETKRGYLVNEMQCIFGQSDDYQMMVNGKPGRYVRSNGEWLFEEGDFARNGCYNLRLEYLIGNLRPGTDVEKQG